LREITQKNFKECIRLKVAPDQESYVADNTYSLAQTKVNPLLTPLAIYDSKIIPHELGEDAPFQEPLQFGPRLMKRQADAVTEEWVQGYLALFNGSQRMV